MQDRCLKCGTTNVVVTVGTWKCNNCNESGSYPLLQDARVVAEQKRFLEALKAGKVGELIDEDNREMDEAFGNFFSEE